MLGSLSAPPRAATYLGTSSFGNPDDTILRWLGGGRTSAGVVVTEEIAMNFAAVFAAVTVWQNAFAVIPWPVYKRRADGGKDGADDHVVSDLLNRRPNPEVTPAVFKDWLIGCKKLWGNAYAEIERSGRAPVNLWHLHPRHVSPERMNPDGTGELIYKVSENNGKVRVVGAEDMLHFKGYSKDGVKGCSVISLARESMGLSFATEQHGAQFFGNSAKPGGILSFPLGVAELDDIAIAKLRQSLKDHFGGANQFSPAVLQNGATWTQIGMSSEDAQFLETRSFQVLEICRWFDVPPHRLAHLADATFSNVEHMEIQFGRQSVAPESVRFNEEANVKLFSLRESQSGLFCEMDLRGTMRGDHAGRASFYSSMSQIGAFTINEVRRLENMNPIGPEGDEHYIQTNQTTADRMASGQVNEQTARQPDEEEEEEDGPAERREAAKAAVMPVFVDACSRVLRRQENEARRARDRDGAGTDKFRAWVNEFYADEPDKICDIMGAACDTLMRMLGAKPCKLPVLALAVGMSDLAKAMALAGTIVGKRAPQDEAVIWTNRIGQWAERNDAA